MARVRPSLCVTPKEAALAKRSARVVERRASKQNRNIKKISSAARTSSARLRSASVRTPRRARSPSLPSHARVGAHVRALLAHAALLRARVVVVVAAAAASPPAGYLVALPPDAADASFDADLALPRDAAFPNRAQGRRAPLRASQAEAFARRHPLALVERDGVVRAQGFRPPRGRRAKVFSARRTRGDASFITRKRKRLLLARDRRSSRRPRRFPGRSTA